MNIRFSVRGFQPGLLVLTLALILAPAVVANAQTTADQLYFSVQRLQDSLGNGDAADLLREQFLIPVLETESGKGFTADPVVLREVARRFEATGDLDPEWASVHDALDRHLVQLDRAVSVDVGSEVEALSTELQTVDLTALAASRERTLAVLRGLEQWSQDELSLYGQHYFDQRLGLTALIDRLSELPLEADLTDDELMLQEEGESDADYQQRMEQQEATRVREFNRDLNRFRQELGQARQRFGRVATSYRSHQIATAEQELANFEQRVYAYLVVQIPRARDAFEELLQRRKQVFLASAGVDDRLYQAELGRWLDYLERRDRQGGLAAAARRDFGKPNFHLTVQESLANQVGAQPVSQMDHLDQVVVGSRAQGWTYTSGLVSLDFVESPYSAVVRVNLSGSIQSSAYTKEGPVTAYTRSSGSFQADRAIRANVGNLSIFDPHAWASVSSEFLGTNCAPLVTRIALNRFSERRSRANEVASELARQQLLDQFTAQTDEALDQGADQLDTMRSRRGELLEYLSQLRYDISQILAEDEQGNVDNSFDMVGQFALPRVFLSTSESQLSVAAVLEGENRLAAPVDPPAATTRVDVRLQVHESMVSNAIAPVIQDRLIENWQFRNLVDSLSSGNAELPEPEDDRPWGIRFEEGRPVQVEFEGNEFGVTVFGKEFRQGREQYTDPISIHVRFRIVEDNGQLKLVRSAPATVAFTYDPLEGKTRSARAITFRQFLQDNLDIAMQGDPLEEAILLPERLIPLEFISEEEVRRQLENVQLVELSTDNGWLTAGWNFGQTDGEIVNTPAIWSDLPEPAEDAETDEEER